MAPTYKLTYAATTGIGEPIRFLLSYGNLNFEDQRLILDEWPKIKPTMPFGQVPVLEVDGKKAYQSVAICRYLAKQLNLLGDNDWEAALIDSVVEAAVDLRTQLSNYFNDKNETTKAAKWETLQKETLPVFFGRFDKTVEENGGYFVSGKLTWADLYFIGIHYYLEKTIGPNMFQNYPNLKKLKEKVEAIPQIKAWIAQRPPDII